MRTNFTGMPGNRFNPGNRESESFFQMTGRRGGESESSKEEAIEIGNSYRTVH
jgi:hypothetical protein